MAHDLRNYSALRIPEDFDAHPDGKPRTLERRAKPRNAEEKTVMMAARGSPGAYKRRWMYPALFAAGVLILAIGMGTFDYWKPTEPITTPVAPPVEKASETAAPEKSVTPATEEKPHDEATLTFAITPWGEIFVDGQSHGVSPPLVELKLSAGKHKIEVRNTGFAPYTETVELNVGESDKIRHKFD
jgi:eukaryotic-like serine/threonine-protein kinase